MSRYYGRRWSVDIGGSPFIAATGDKQFRVTFNVLREFGEAVSYADIAFYNLSQETAQKAIKRHDPIVFRAGYEDTIDTIFSGRIINVLRERQGPTTITRLICRAGFQTEDKTVSKSFGKDATLAPIIRECVSAMGYAIEINDADFADVSPYPRGYTLFGDPREYLNKLAEAQRFDWVVEGDTVVIVGFNKFRKGETFIVSQFTGMVGIPEITEVGCDVKVRLNPKVKIGGQIDIKSELATFNFSNLYYTDIPESAGKGIYNIFRVTFTGDSHGDDWNTAVTCYRPDYTGSLV